MGFCPLGFCPHGIFFLWDFFLIGFFPTWDFIRIPKITQRLKGDYKLKCDYKLSNIHKRPIQIDCEVVKLNGKSIKA